MTVVRMPSKNHAAQHDTSRLCCDGKCFQRNPSQGGSCPLDRVGPIDPPPSLADGVMDAAWWLAGFALLGALATACLEGPL